MVAKVMMLFVALSGSIAIAQERAQNTLWYLVINRTSYFSIVWAKFKAQLMVLILLWLHLALAAGVLSTGGALNWQQVVIGVMGFTLFMLWLMALGVLISSHCQSTGTAVLLSLVVFVAVWMLGSDVAGEEYGLNWLKLFSPQSHLKWFCAGELSLSSLVYFLGGCLCFLWLTKQQLIAIRKQS
jgi:ABC-type transport system involved in multi-copper enzyme maturation permease subunit